MEQTNLSINLDPLLVGASFLVAILASYAALAIINYLRQARTGKSWLWLGASTFGLGLWAVHYIAISALQLDMLVTYNPLIALASVFYVIFGAAAAFQLVGKPVVSPSQLLGSGFFLGSGMAIMHYVGMFSVRLDARLQLDPVMVGISALVAVGLGTFGVWILTNAAYSVTPSRHFIAAIITGSAIPFIPYIAMLATRFTGAGNEGIQATFASGNLVSLNIFMLLAIAALGLPMFLTSLFGAFAEKRPEVEA